MQLYKYMPADRALVCLPEIGNGTLRATPPIALNDPYESFVRKLRPDREQDLSDEQLVSLLRNIYSGKPLDITMIVQAREQHGSNYLRELFARQLSFRYGIVSFSADPFHPLMWSHYAGEGAGFVVGYDERQLREALDSAVLHRVRYVDTPVLWDYPATQISGSLAITIMCSKSCHWMYEKEWRLIVELKDTIGTGSEERHATSIPINLVRIPNEAVRSVYFAERTPREILDALESRLANTQNRYVNAHVRKLVLAEDEYVYRRVCSQHP